MKRLCGVMAALILVADTIAVRFRSQPNIFFEFSNNFSNNFFSPWFGGGNGWNHITYVGKDASGHG